MRDSYSTDEYADRLGISSDPVRALIKSGRLGHVNIGVGQQKRFRILARHAEAYEMEYAEDASCDSDGDVGTVSLKPGTEFIK